MTLAVYSRVRQLGRITLAGGKLAGSAAGVQDLADAAVRKAGGDAAKAYAALEGWTNGYLTVITDPAEQEAARQPHDGGAWTVTGQLPDGTNAALSWDGGLGAGWTDDATAWLAEAAAAGDVQGDNGTAVREWLQARGFYAAHDATPAGEGVEAAWDPELHPRDERGRFTTRGELLTRKPPAGTRRMAVTPGGIKAGDWLALGGRKGGYKVAAVEALPGDGTNPGPTRIHFEGGGRILLAWSYHQPRHGGVPVYRHVEQARHPKPPKAPVMPGPGSPEALFTGMAGSFYIEPGVTAAQKRKVAAALATLPDRTRQELKTFGWMRRISIRQHAWRDRAPEGEITADGQYDPDKYLLTVAADSSDLTVTADHEALHAWDRHPSGAFGRFSVQADFGKLADEIRGIEQKTPRMVGAHYQPYLPPGRLGADLEKAGNMEMFAELGADYLTRRPYNLSYEPGVFGNLGPRITAKLDAYYSSVFFGDAHPMSAAGDPGQQWGLRAAAAGGGELTCVKAAGPDGTPRWLFTDGDGYEIDPATGERTGRRLAPPPEPPGGEEGTAPAAGDAGDTGPAWTVTGQLPDGTHAALSWDGGLAGWPDDALGWLVDAVAAGEVQGDDGAAVREWLQARGFTATAHAAFDPGEPRDPHGEWTSGHAGPLEGDELWQSGTGRTPVSGDEAARIKNVWWSENYQDTNDWLRFSTRPDWAASQPGEFRKYRADIGFFVSKLHSAEPLHHAIRLYRGVSNAQEVFGPPGSAVGKTLTDRGIVAASATRASAEFFTGSGDDPALVTIDVPAGMRAVRADMEGMKEFDMPPNSRFKVMSDTVEGGERQLRVMVAAQPKKAPAAVRAAAGSPARSGRFAWRPGDIEIEIDDDARAAAGQGTTAGQAASAIAYAGDAAAHEVYERLHAAWPGGYRHAVNEGAPGQDAYVGPEFLRMPMRQPWPERVDGLRAEIRRGNDIGPSLAVVHRGLHVLVDGTHHAVARVLEGQRNIPLRVLELPPGREPAVPDTPAAAFNPGQPRDPRTGKWVAGPGAGSVRDQLAAALRAEQDDTSRAGLPDLADRLGTAAQMVTERRGYPASHLRDTASQARRAGHPDRAGRYEDLARQILAIPDDQATPAPAEPEAPRPPELSGADLWQSGEGTANPTEAEAEAAERVWYSSKAVQTAAYLRGSGGKPPPGQQGADITAFIGLIHHSAPFTQPAVMWRGTYGGDRLFGPPGSAKGKRFTDAAPVSATASEDTAMSYGDTLIRLHVPAGAHALRADEGIWAAAGGGIANTDYPLATVQEYTLLPGSAFEVTGDGTVSSFYGRRRVLDVDMLPEGTPAPPAAPMAAAGSSGPDLAGLPGGDRFAWRPGQVRFGDPAGPASSPQAAFNPAERRDAHGRWRPWTDAARSRNPRFYHGTTTDLEDTAGREGQYTYFTPSFYQASTFARRHARLAGGTPRVYPVEPAGKYGDDPLSYQGLRTRAPLRVTGPAWATPSTAEMSQLARTYRTPEVQHGPLYIGRDKDYERDRDAWEASVAAAFNPAEIRDREGKWTSTGGPKVAGLAPAGRYTMRGVPAGHPLRARLDARLTTAQHRRGKPAELTRPALPRYEEAVARTAAAIVREIKTQDTLEEGRGWYPHEHQLAEQRAKAYGVPVQVAAAVEAATSPRVHWDINQRVTNEILDEIPKAGQPAADIIAAHRLGGGVMWKFRDDATAIALGGDIGEHLHGAKVRSYYSNIMWPGQTGQVTVDTWMNQALVSGLGLTGEQAAALAGEHPKEFPEGIGRMLAADATRAAAEQLTANGEPAAPDQVQAAYWLAAQAAAGAKPAALWAAAEPEAAWHFNPFQRRGRHGEWVGDDSPGTAPPRPPGPDEARALSDDELAAAPGPVADAERARRADHSGSYLQLWHGTSRDNARSISRQGLRGTYDQADPTLSPERIQARLLPYELNPALSWPDNPVAVLDVRVPAGKEDEYLFPPEGPIDARALRKPLPPEMIYGHKLEPHYDPVAAASPADGQLEDLDDDHWDAELLLDDLGWLAADIPGRIDLGPPGSARPHGGYAAGNPAAWAIATADPRFAALGMTTDQAQQAAHRAGREQEAADALETGGEPP